MTDCALDPNIITVHAPLTAAFDAHVLLDAKVSMKAKGVAALLLASASWDGGQDLTTDQLAALSADRRGAVLGALRELEGAGYLTRSRRRDDNGRICWVRTMRSRPAHPPAAQDRKGLDSAAMRKRSPSAPVAHMPPVAAPSADFPPVDTPTMDAPAVDGPSADAPAVDTPAVDTPPVDAPAVDASVMGKTGDNYAKTPAPSHPCADCPYADQPTMPQTIAPYAKNGARFGFAAAYPAPDAPSAAHPAPEGPSMGEPWMDAPWMDAPWMDAPWMENPPMVHPPVVNESVTAPLPETPSTDAPWMENPPMVHPPMVNESVAAPLPEGPSTDAPWMENPPMVHPPMVNESVAAPAPEVPSMDAPWMENPPMVHPPVAAPSTAHPGMETPSLENPPMVNGPVAMRAQAGAREDAHARVQAQADAREYTHAGVRASTPTRADQVFIINNSSPSYLRSEIYKKELELERELERESSSSSQLVGSLREREDQHARAGEPQVAAPTADAREDAPTRFRATGSSHVQDARDAAPVTRPATGDERGVVTFTRSLAVGSGPNRFTRAARPITRPSADRDESAAVGGGRAERMPAGDNPRVAVQSDAVMAGLAAADGRAAGPAHEAAPPGAAQADGGRDWAHGWPQAGDEGTAAGAGMARIGTQNGSQAAANGGAPAPDGAQAGTERAVSAGADAPSVGTVSSDAEAGQTGSGAGPDAPSVGTVSSDAEGGQTDSGAEGGAAGAPDPELAKLAFQILSECGVRVAAEHLYGRYAFEHIRAEAVRFMAQYTTAHGRERNAGVLVHRIKNAPYRPLSEAERQSHCYRGWRTEEERLQDRAELLEQAIDQSAGAAPVAPAVIAPSGSPAMPRGLRLPGGYVPAGEGANAVQVYYERFHYADPDAHLSRPQEDDLLRLCPDLGRLREVVIAYSRTNYRRGNVQLVIDWYNNGVPGREGAGTSRGARPAANKWGRVVAQKEEQSGNTNGNATTGRDFTAMAAATGLTVEQLQAISRRRRAGLDAAAAAAERPTGA